MQKAINKTRPFLITVLAVIMLISSALVFPARAADTASGDISDDEIFIPADGVSSVRLEEQTLKVEVTLSSEWLSANSGAQIYIFAFEPYESVSSLNEKKPVGFAPAKKSMTVDVPLLDDSGNTRVYSKFAAAMMKNTGDYSIVGTAVYIGNTASAAKITTAYPTFANKKGLNIQLPANAQILGVTRTVLTVAMNDFILGIYDTAPENSLACNVGGITVYFNLSKLTALDNKIKAFTDSGVEVYLQTVLSSSTDENLSPLYHEGAAGTATLYFPNITTEKSYAMVRAFFELLAERYGDPSGEHGFAASYIVGFEVNTPDYFNNAGSLSHSSYLYSYAALLRLADTAVKINYSSGRVFVSVSNKWADETTGARTFLKNLAAAVLYGGDFDWGLSSSVYASDNSNSAVWKESNADYTQNTAYITPINYSVTLDFMKTTRMMTTYGGKTSVRNIIIGDFGVSGDPSDSASLANQAASYAYMYYYAVQNEEIDALIYHRHVDSALESGRYFGLYSNEHGTVFTPSATKPILDIFRKIDITEPSEISSALIKLGAAFTDTDPDLFDGTYTPSRKIIEAIPLSAASMPNGRAKDVFDFNTGDDFGFFAAEGASYVLCRPTAGANGSSETALFASLDGSNALDYMGVGVNLTENSAFERAGYISFNCMSVIDGAKSGSYVTVMLRLEGSENNVPVIYEGIAQVSAGGWGNFTFDIRDFIKSAGVPDTMRIWVKPDIATTADGEYELYIGKVSLYGNGSMATWLKVVLIILALAVLAAGAYGVRYYLRQKKITRAQNALPRSQRPVGYGSRPGNANSTQLKYGQPLRSPNEARQAHQNGGTLINNPQGGQYPRQVNTQNGQYPRQANTQSGQYPRQANTQSGQYPRQANTQSGQYPRQANPQGGQHPRQTNPQGGQYPRQPQQQNPASRPQQAQHNDTVQYRQPQRPQNPAVQPPEQNAQTAQYSRPVQLPLQNNDDKK